jgi:hypothetical protein
MCGHEVLLSLQTPAKFLGTHSTTSVTVYVSDASTNNNIEQIYAYHKSF